MKNKNENSNFIETEIIDTLTQTPIEIALGIDKNGMTTASKLYSFLELYPNNFARWCRKNILNNKFAIQNEDYIPFFPQEERNNPKPKQDYKITATFAKKLSMTGNTQKHEQARNYFVACEQGLKIAAERTSCIQITLQSLTEAISALTNSVNEIKAQTNKTNEILLRVLNDNKKDIFKTNGLPEWTKQMMPYFSLIKRYYFPKDSGFKSTYAKIFSEFNEMYGSYLLSQASDDFCYQNNCIRCNTMDMVAYTPEIREKIEIVINNIIKDIIKTKKDELNKSVQKEYNTNNINTNDIN